MTKLVLCLFLASTGASSAYAQELVPAERATPIPKKVSQADLRKAREVYARGAEHQAAGEYAEAIAAYEEAFALTESPALWFNMGQAFRLMGNKDQALLNYRRYLEAEPEGQAAPEAYGHIQALEAEIREARETVERGLAEARARKAQEEAARLEAQHANENEERRLRFDALAKIDAQARARARRYQVIGLVSAGSGALLALTGVYFHSEVADKESLIAGAQGAWSLELDQAVEDGKAADRNAVIFYSVGGTAMVAGATLLLLGEYLKPQKREQGLKLDVSATPASASAQLRLSF